MAFDESFEHQEVQSMVFSGFPALPAVRYCVLKVLDATAARQGLAALVSEDLDFGLLHRKAEKATQLGLSAAGLRALGLPEEALTGFSRGFCQGMATPRRARILGDLGKNAVESWEWTGHDALLMVFARDIRAAEKASGEMVERLLGGWSLEHAVTGCSLPNGKEHFGWRDGLSQPRIRGLGFSAAMQDIVEPGEFVLGYPDNTGETPPSPVFEDVALGRNGTYLVARQLEQDVEAFWKQWRALADGDDDLAVFLASKALGRWPNGMPISPRATRMPAQEPYRLKEPLFFRGDPVGRGCPLGSHIRRANPRDGLSTGPETSFATVGRHRILRRGRAYGRVAPVDVYPDAAVVPADDRGTADDEARGLLFACVCADIERQFEFTQQTWLNNTKQAGLDAESDTIAAGDELLNDAFVLTIPETPVRRLVHDVRNFVRMRGGGYYFMPGKAALSWIASR